MGRRTLAGPAIVEGVGLHTGARTTARCLPSAPGEGIRFRRTDLPGAPPIAALLSEVRSTERRTALGDDPVAGFILKFLKTEGVETAYIPQKPGTRTGDG